jgi:superfamily II RNA helicase
MVKICEYKYPKSREEEYKKYYENYSYELHDFQKWCVEGVVTGNHVLICCPTGSGKTFGGEFALQYFHSKQKKTIYTSPIKALSNEKFHAFTHKYPDISVGLITGDIKTNPDADVLIMTTEILLNKLYQIKSSNHSLSSSTSFDMDIENDLGCVVFDEIHMINDEHRGHVWEQSIMLLPSHIQMIGLSATLDNPERFAFWLETKGDINKSVEKQVYLTRKLVRAVPLIHYSFIAGNNSINKHIKDKALQEEIKHLINKPFVIQDDKNVFNDVNYQNMTRTLKLFEKNDVKIKRPFVLNKLAEYLVENEMLPALCYVFSRKQLEICAEEMTVNLLEFDSKVPYTIDRECEQIIRKLPNYQEYLHLPEYINTIKLLRKGVGIHHAGLMPILREMTELLFARGFIKILFCTETMSVGINLPVKTTIFTDVNKFNGDIIRMLYSHEYTQSAGRAGRLGLDTVGHVIHLNNLFRNIDSVSYKNMMNGKPQSLTSKFKISYNLLLNLLDIGDNNLVEFAKKSMIMCDLDEKTCELSKKMSSCQTEIERLNGCLLYLRTPTDIINAYIGVQKDLKSSVNKKRKELERKIQMIKDNHKFIEQDQISYLKISEKQNELTLLEKQYGSLNSYFNTGVSSVLNFLKEEGFIHGDNCGLSLTLNGKIASKLREIHCLAFTKLYDSKKLDTLTSKQLIALFSCFTNIKVVDDYKEHFPRSDDPAVNEIINDVRILYNYYIDKELHNNIHIGFDYEIHYELVRYVEKWCDCECVEDCKFILQELGKCKEIFLGEFVKAILKINNISSEFEQICELTGNIELLSKLKEIPTLTLKYVVTNQSLYV